MNKSKREMLELLRDMGVEVIGFARGGKHYRIQVRWHGIERTLTAPVSASDHRAWLNWKSQIRKSFKEKPRSQQVATG